MNNTALISRLLPLLLAACAATPPAQPPAPDALRPGPGETHALTVAAAGVQIYECRVGQNGGAPQWAFVAPDARLFDALRGTDPAIGAKAIVRAYEPEIVNVSIADPGAFVDIDTADEYQNVLRAMKGNSLLPNTS